MSDSPEVTRREFLQKALLFSAALMAPQFSRSAPSTLSPAGGTLHLFCLGDWGSGADANQSAVAKAMQDYARSADVRPHALMLLGDNFYGALPGTDSPRWEREFESMYPASAFPGACYAILGNHDYDDQRGGEKIQLAYAKTPGTRWKMPARWYRLDLPEDRPVATLLCTNTHYAKLSPSEIAEQQRWLETELAAPRTTPCLMVLGHHPIFSCGPHHGDSPYLQPWSPLFHERQVHAYVCGHEHDLQHLREPGRYTDYIVSGAGGRALHPVQANEKTQFAKEQFGFLHLSISSGELNAAFVGTGATVFYSFNRKLAS